MPPARAGRTGDAAGVSVTDLLVGVDIGTTACKAAAVTPSGAVIAEGRAPTPWTEVATGAELDPGLLVDAALTAVGQAVDAVPRGRVVALGVTGMAETGVLLDGRGEALAPAIAWYDTRGEQEAERLAAELGQRNFTIRTGLPATSLCSLAKYAWLRAHHDDARRATRWLNVGEWVCHRLGGAQLAEASLSSRTGFLDVAERSWWPEALAWADAPATLLPDIAWAGESWGRVTEGPAALRGAQLTVAGHDHLCAAIGAGAIRDGDVFDSCGTAEAFVRGVDPVVGADDILRAVTGGVTVGWHAIPDRQALLGGFMAGGTLQHILDLLGVGRSDTAALDESALAVPPGSYGLQVWDVTTPAARITGIGAHASPGALWRAALEAVTAEGERVLSTIEAVAGPTRRLVVTGGWAASTAARALKAERLSELEHPPVVEAGARGAALMAGCAAGLFAGVGDLPGAAVSDDPRG